MISNPKILRLRRVKLSLSLPIPSLVVYRTNRDERFWCLCYIPGPTCVPYNGGCRCNTETPTTKKHTYESLRRSLTSPISSARALCRRDPNLEHLMSSCYSLEATDSLCPNLEPPSSLNSNLESMSSLRIRLQPPNSLRLNLEPPSSLRLNLE